jgi:hypothetical protein
VGLGGGEPGAAPGTVVSKLTVGALWAPALAENSGMGFELEYSVAAQMLVGNTRKVVL